MDFCPEQSCQFWFQIILKDLSVFCQMIMHVQFHLSRVLLRHNFYSRSRSNPGLSETLLLLIGLTPTLLLMMKVFEKKE